MTKEELKKIIEKHKKWLKNQEGGECADLRGAYLRGADLSCADLCCADLCDADLRGADLRDAYLRGAKLCGAKLCGANLRGANLCDANLCAADLCEADLCGAIMHEATLSGANLHDAELCGANLCDADLCGANLCRADLYDASLYNADLCGADLCGANLRDADLCGAKLHDANNMPFIPMTCPDSGSFTAWKKANGYIIKLLIPEDARRSSSTGHKCRCDKAFVVAIETLGGESTELDEIASDYDGTFIYKVGETVTEPNFCEDRFNECAAGIHFFIYRQEAVDYN